MAMEIKRGAGDPIMEINMTPLIDVMLVLLTLLIITLPIQTNAVKLDMPRESHGDMMVIVNLGVDFDDTIQWNGTRIDRATLDSYLLDASQADPQPEIHLSPNELAHYDVVAKILADAQRLGVHKLGFAGLDQYIE